MERRLRHFLSLWGIVTIVVLAASVMCAVGAVGAWINSYRTSSPDPTSFRLLGGRYTLLNERGYLRLLGPPGQPASTDAASWDLVKKLSNESLSWRVQLSFYDRLTFSSIPLVPTRPPSLRATDLTRPLLEALEDPSRFAAAHLWLDRNLQMERGASTRELGDRLVVTYDGLEVTLRPSFLSVDRRVLEAQVKQAQQRSDLFVEVCVSPDRLQIDRAQIVRLRRQWHDRLDVRVFSVPHWTILALTLLPTAVIARHWWRTHRANAARARNCCMVCGYDLRSGHERCPECGTPSRPVTATLVSGNAPLMPHNVILHSQTDRS